MGATHDGPRRPALAAMLVVTALVGCASSVSMTDAGATDTSETPTGAMDARAADAGAADTGMTDAGTTDAGAPTIDGGAGRLEDLCRDVTAAQCLATSRCLHSPTTAEDCVAEAARRCRGDGDLALSYYGRVALAVRAGRLAYDAVEARRCVEALPSSADYCRARDPNVVPSCVRMLRGTVAAGGDCHQILGALGPDECAGGRCYFGERLAARCPGVCLAYLAVGSACDLRAPCEAGSECLDGSCQRFAPAGAACDRHTCEGGLRCLAAGGGFVCGAPIADGQPCGRSLDCRSMLCTGGRCVANPATDGPCANPDVCPAGSTCRRSDDGSTRVCVPWLAAGAACDASSTCARGLQCVCSVDRLCNVDPAQRGTCQPTPQRREGDACYEYGCADGFYCSTADSARPTCRARLGPGAACVPRDSGCREGLGCSAATMTCVPSALPGEPCTTNGTVCLGGSCGGARCQYEGRCTEQP